MGSKQLQDYLNQTIPTELYKIRRDEIVFFVPNGSINQTNISWIEQACSFLLSADPNANVAFDIIHTGNKMLMNTVAGRKPNEDETQYEVVVSTNETIAGFAATYFDVMIDHIIQRTPKGNLNISLSSQESPVIVSIDHRLCPSKEPFNISSWLDSPFSDGEYTIVGSYQHRLEISDPNSFIGRKQILKEKKKLIDLFKECAVLGIDLDIDSIKQEAYNELKTAKKDYKLIIKTKFNKMTCESCDIYVGEGEEYKIKLTPIEKAVYITFLLYDNGIKVRQALLPEARNITKTIYSKMPIDEMNEKMEGILNPGDSTREQQAKTLRTNITYINKAIKQIIPDPLIAQEFCIVTMTNETDSPYAVERTTAEIQEKIRKEFGV